MPYKSKAQQAYFHTDSAKKAGITSSMVEDFDKASKGLKLPKKAKRFRKIQNRLGTKD